MKKTKKIKETKEQEVVKEEVKETKEQFEKRMSIYGYVIIGVTIAILIGLAIYLCLNQLNSKFTYEGMEFNKIYKNNEWVYSTTFVTKKLINGTFYVDNRTFYLRNNPKYLKLDRTIEGSMPIISDRDVYISIDEPLPKCKDRIRSLFDLSASLVNYGLTVKGAVVNQTKAEQNRTEITCANSTQNTVIILTQGEYTGFKKMKDNCYVIGFKDCSDLGEATEGFTLKLLERLAYSLGMTEKN